MAAGAACSQDTEVVAGVTLPLLAHSGGTALVSLQSCGERGATEGLPAAIRISGTLQELRQAKKCTRKSKAPRLPALLT